MKHIVIAALASLAMLSGTVVASATTVTYTYTGVVTTGVSVTGVFAPRGTDLSGASYTAVETFDLSKQAYQTTDGSTYQDVFGGPGNGGSSGFGSATLTINSETISLADNTSSEVASFKENDSFTSVADNLGLYGYLQFAVDSPSTPGSVTTPYSVMNPGLGSGGTLGGSYDNLSFSVTELTVSDSAMSAVPLPASAPLFGAALLALGGIGFGLKRGAISFEV